MTLAEIVALVAASAAAGMMNAMAGGGTIVTFPTLLLLGEPAITANATSTVALLPGALASMAGFRRDVASHREWLRVLLLPSLVGGAIGAVLLLRTPEAAFARLAPVLVLFATILFVVQGGLARRSSRRNAAGPGEPAGPGESGRRGEPSEFGEPGEFADAAGAPGAAEDHSPGAPADTPRGRWLTALLLQFLVSIYGGYFGAAIGILMLAVLGFLGLRNIFAMNGLKNFFGFCINGVAAAYFIFRGAVIWPVALIMMAGSIAGGYGGARFSQRIGKQKSRAAVVVIGLVVTAVLFWQQSRH
jgi:uncharacterized membrane protein YfcA